MEGWSATSLVLLSLTPQTTSDALLSTSSVASLSVFESCNPEQIKQHEIPSIRGRRHVSGSMNRATFQRWRWQLFKAGKFLTTLTSCVSSSFFTSIFDSSSLANSFFSSSSFFRFVSLTICSNSWASVSGPALVFSVSSLEEESQMKSCSRNFHINITSTSSTEMPTLTLHPKQLAEQS